jgi:hypothetical protein
LNESAPGDGEEWMTQPEPGAHAHTASLAGALRPVLADTLLALRGLELHIEVVSQPPDPTGWLDASALAEPDGLPLSALLQRFKSAGFAFNKRAASASLMLRCGWASGFAIAAYLTRARVPFLGDFALHFSPSALLKGLWVREAQFVGRAEDPLAGGPEWVETVGEDVLRERLLASLIAFNEPLIAAHHAWSRFSRHALWAMATSSWAAQFASVARQLGDEKRGVYEARTLLALIPEIKRAAPELYEVEGGGNSRTCQKLRACCLYFKSGKGQFCACCPIIPDAERLERNRSWVAAQRPQAQA